MRYTSLSSLSPGKSVPFQKIRMLNLTSYAPFQFMVHSIGNSYEAGEHWYFRVSDTVSYSDICDLMKSSAPWDTASKETGVYRMKTTSELLATVQWIGRGVSVMTN